MTGDNEAKRSISQITKLHYCEKVLSRTAPHSALRSTFNCLLAKMNNYHKFYKTNALRGTF